MVARRRHEMNRDMLGRRLARRGYQVLFTVDGVEGIVMALSSAGSAARRWLGGGATVEDQA